MLSPQDGFHFRSLLDIILTGTILTECQKSLIYRCAAMYVQVHHRANEVLSGHQLVFILDPAYFQLVTIRIDVSAAMDYALIKQCPVA